MTRRATNYDATDSATGPDETLARRIMDHVACLYSIAHRIVGEANLAEDVVAQTLLKAWATRAQLREPDRLQGWLKAICRNEAASLLRSRKRHDLRMLPPEELAIHPTPCDPAAGSDLLDGLPAELKVCAELFFIEGRSYAQIARLTSLPLSTIRGRIHLSRRHLRKEIEMRTEPVESIASDQPQILRPRTRQVTWRQTRVRLLGVLRLGAQALYDPAGKRLSRLPAALQGSELLDSLRSERLQRDGLRLAFFCEVAGETPLPPGMRAVGFTARPPGSERPCLPTMNRYEDRSGRTVVCHLCGEPDEATEVNLHSRLLGPEDRSRPLRLVPEGHLHSAPDDFIAITNPQGGILFLSERRPGPSKGTCTFTLAMSTPFDQRANCVLVVDRAGREVEPIRTRGGHFSAAAGHLHAETIDVALLPKDVAGVAIYPRFTAVVNWGKVRLPPPT